MSIPIVKLKQGRDSSLLRRHPWIFSGAIESVSGNPGSGDTVQVVSHGGSQLGIGAYSPVSQIRVRLFTFAPARIDRDFFVKRVNAAVARRNNPHNTAKGDACRLVYGESDGLPGLIVDRYGDFLVCQFLFAGVERWKAELVEILALATGCLGIYERSDSNAREKEGLAQTQGLLWGALPPGEILIREYGMSLGVDVCFGQKTGFYLDQAENRQRVGKWCQGLRVLNCFAYTGGFSVAALQHGAAHVTSVDSSAPALALTSANIIRNGGSQEQHFSECGNVFHLLRDWQKSARSFDLIILDPPKFADNKSQVPKAARAYKDLALQAVRLLPAGGILVNFSCSGSIDMGLFQKITADAFLDAGAEGEILEFLHQSPDHPVSLAFPESQYLKGLVCRRTH